MTLDTFSNLCLNLIPCKMGITAPALQGIVPTEVFSCKGLSGVQTRKCCYRGPSVLASCTCERRSFPRRGLTFQHLAPSVCLEVRGRLLPLLSCHPGVSAPWKYREPSMLGRGAGRALFRTTIHDVFGQRRSPGRDLPRDWTGLDTLVLSLKPAPAQCDRARDLLNS